MIYKNNKNIQLTFNLKKKKIYDENNFLVSKSNKEAYKLINKWPDWLTRKLIVFGDPGNEKHIYRIFGKKKVLLKL